MNRLEPNGPTDPPPTSGTPPTSKYKRAKTTSKVPSDIVIDPDYPSKKRDPDLKEEKDGSHAMVIGGFSPFTIAHHEVVKQMQNAGHGSVHVFTTTSKRRPIAPEKKVGYIKKAVGNKTNVSTAQTPLHAASKVYEAGHRGNLTFYGGSDRSEIADRIRQYNGKKGAHGFYKFEKIDFNQVGGERKEGGSGMAGISGTAARNSSSPEELKKYIPKALHPHAKEIFNDLKEELVFEGAVLGVKQRMMRGVQAKKNKAKLALARKIAKERMAKSPALKRRAQKIARRLMRVRAAGKRAKAYTNLSVADKIALDRLVKDKSKIIQAIAKKVVPRVRTREVQRLAGITPQQRTKVPMMMSFDPSEIMARPDTKKTDKTKLRRQTEYYKKIIEDSGLDQDLLDSIMTKILSEKQDPIPVTSRDYKESGSKIKKYKFDIPIKQQVPSQKKSQKVPEPTSVVEMTLKEIRSLEEKATSSGVPFDVLRQVFQRGMKAANQKRPPGMTNQQAAFARIASFLNKGKAYQKEDSDLAELLEKSKKQGADPSKREWGTTSLANTYKRDTPGQVEEANKMKGEDPCWKGYEMVGHKKKNGKKVPNCVPEERMSFKEFSEATYQGKKVPLNKPMAGDVKKSKVYVDPDGDGIAKKVNFGDPNMTIKKDNPARRRSFRARHNCDNPGPKDKPRFWSCKMW